MTKEEFYKEYKRMFEKFPTKFDLHDQKKLILLYDMVKTLEAKWWAKIVDRVLLTNNTEFDFRSAAAGEIRSRYELKRTMEMVTNEPVTTENALERVLEGMGASSLVDILKTSQNGANDVSE